MIALIWDQLKKWGTVIGRLGTFLGVPLAAAAAAAAVTGAMVKGIDSSLKGRADKYIDAIMTDVTRHKGNQRDYELALDAAMQSPSNKEPARQKYLEQQLTSSPGLSDKEKKIAKDYFEKRRSPTAAPVETAAPAPTATPAVTPAVTPTPVTPTPVSVTPPSPAPSVSTPASEDIPEISVTSKRTPTTVGDTGVLEKPKTIIQRVKDFIVKAAKMVGIDPSIMLAMGHQESSFNPNAAAGTSSAKGLFQFTKGTWNDTVNKYSDQYPELLNGPLDPLASSIAGGLFARDNANMLKKNNIPVTGSNIYAAHFLGATGATKLLTADPSALAVDVVGEKAAKANKNVFYDKKGNPVTVSKVKDFLYKRVGSKADQFAAELNAETPPTPLLSVVTSTGSTTPARSSSGPTLDNGSKQVDVGKSAAMQPASPVIIAPLSAPAAPKAPPVLQRLPDANPRSSESAFGRALAKDYSHPTAFTTVGTI